MAAKALNVLSESVNGHEIIKIPGKQIYGIQFHPEHIDPKNDGKEVFNEILEEIFEVNKI
jgi:anthranilate/para-aminobenzoate synthase component II